ncbi:MAG: polysaccharide biosynthesis/export family protein [Desulfuromonadales bacterium]|nr:polysaccharide biosynthesis/export family protein [Desulfuromonadales bacterium]
MMLRWITVILTVLMLSMPIPASAADYVIGDGDVLDVAVWGVRELSFSAIVRPDGKITVPGLGEVTATGKTPHKLQKLLEEGLRTLVKNPIVTVSIRQITNNQVHIFGGGVTSGVFDLSRRTTLLQLLCQISNFSEADLTRAYVLRDDKKVKTGFDQLFLKGNASEDMVLQAGDVIFIPLAEEKNVYVLGAVNMPRFIPYREGLTVMEAILEAGGFNKFARPNDTLILRDQGGKKKSIEVRMKDLGNGDLSQNVKLQVGDYIIIKEGIF